MDDTRPQLQPFDDEARQLVLGQLRESAVEHHGHLWVAFAFLRRLMSPHVKDGAHASVQYWIKRDRIRKNYIRVKGGPRTGEGRLLLLHLDDLSECLQTYRPRRIVRWTPAMHNTLIDHWGKQPVRNIADRLGVSSDAAKFQARQLGLSAAASSGAWGTASLAELLGIPSFRFNHWTKIGLRSTRTSGGIGLRMIEPESLAEFFAQRPDIASRVPTRGLEKLRQLVDSRRDVAPERYRGRAGLRRMGRAA